MRIITWSEFSRGEVCVHVAESCLAPGEAFVPHTHDYRELFWVREGRGTHRINGEDVPLRENALVLVDQADVHSLHADAGVPFRYRNVAFLSAALDDLLARYGEIGALLADPASDEGGTGDRYAFSRSITPAQREWIDAASAALGSGPGHRFALDRFLMNLFDECFLPEGGRDGLDLRLCPEWLCAALERMRDPENFREGAPALYRLADRSREHVARVLKQSTGRTVTETVNAIRLQAASSRLRLSGEAILPIALSCGFSSLSHFYKLFRQAYGQPPRQYRNSHRAPFPTR